MKFLDGEVPVGGNLSHATKSAIFMAIYRDHLTTKINRFHEGFRVRLYSC